MALSATNSPNEPRSFSLGPVKAQLITFSVASGDVSGTVTCDKLSKVDYCIVSGITKTATPTFSGNVITLAFVDPAATVFGEIIAMGK